MESRQKAERAGSNAGKRVWRVVLCGLLCIVAVGLLLTAYFCHRAAGGHVGFFIAGVFAALAWVTVAVAIGAGALRRLVEKIVRSEIAEAAMETYVRMSRRDRSPVKGK